MAHTLNVLERHIFGLLVLLQSSAAIAQPSPQEAGRPFITTYSQKQTGGQFQSWSFIQDSRGVIYVGNNAGVLEFDGTSWRLIETAQSNIARSLAIDSLGHIFVGSTNDFGWLLPDSTGKLRYFSLFGNVPEPEREFSYIWTVRALDGGVYFQSRERIFRLKLVDSSRQSSLGDTVSSTSDRTTVSPSAGEKPEHAGPSCQVKVWKPVGRFGYAFVVGHTYYVQQGGVGLMKMEGDSLKLLPGGEQFAEERLQVMLPFVRGGPEGEKAVILVGTFNRGLFLFDGRSFQPFKTEVDEFLKSNTLYDGALLPDGSIAFATLVGGVVVIDRQGHQLVALNQRAGLTSNSVNALFVDHHGLLWAAPENGISIIETPSPLSRFDGASGVVGAVSDIIRHKGILYAATSNGLYFLDRHTSAFSPVSGWLPGNRQAFALIPMGERLLAAMGTGVYQIEGSRASLVRANARGTSFNPISLLRSRQDSNRVFVGLFDGLASLRLERSGRWIDEGRIQEIQTYVLRMAEPEPGVLWLGTADTGPIRIRFEGPSLEHRAVDHFGPEQGFQASGGSSVYNAGGRLFVTSKAGVYRFDDGSQRFILDSLMAGIGVGGSPDEYQIKEDARGDLWVNIGRESAIFRRQVDATYRVDKTPLLRFADVQSTAAIYPEADGVVWFGNAESIIRYDANLQKDYGAGFPSLIRRVVVNEDSVLFAGAASWAGRPSPRLPHKENALRFEFAATHFENPTETQFQVMLEGFDPHWSAWSKEAKKDYTNLPEGAYRFRVRALNIYQHVSEEASFGFSILPPWYRTWPAYGLYALAFLGAAFGMDRLQRRRLIRKERRQARLREAELRAKAAENLAQSERERKKNVELLSEIGREITASLDFDTIFYRLYERVNQLVDASVFGVGIYHPETQEIEYRLAVEKGKRYAPYSRDARDRNQFPVWCIEHREAVFINDVNVEFGRYIGEYRDPRRLLEDGSYSEAPQSLIYLPLIAQERVLGVITVQSFRTHAYTDVHLSILKTLAAYSSIALDNADAYRRLNATLENLNATQEQLVAQQKLASLGALTAGIAHEIKNPLNFVNNFSELSLELLQELREELSRGKNAEQAAQDDAIGSLLRDLEQNAMKVNEHGKRADSIVRSMLQHSRGRTGDRQETDINAMVEENLNLAYHGTRAQNAEFNIKMEKLLDPSIGKVRVVPQDLSRVLLNVITNGFYEAHRKKKASGPDFAPILTVSTRNLGDTIEIRVRDNGNGIPPAVREKIFTPFFTTKPTGQGTGLGLSLSHDIVVKEHHGSISFESEEGAFTEFIIRLPKNGASHREN